MLGELTDSTQSRASEHRSRKSRHIFKSFRKDEEDYASSEGWELVRQNQASTRYQKLKGHDEQLENEFWCLLYNFGYPHLNIGRRFQIEISNTLSKQVDVFAHDDETIIVAECKSCEKRSRRSFQKDIGEFAANQKAISNSMRKHFGGTFNQKIIWLFVTKNIDWSEPDRERAKEANIRIVTEKELFYYKEIAKRIGHAARYQFHAEFLSKTKVYALENQVFALRAKLGTLKAYMFFAPAKTVLPLAYVNHRDLRDPNAAPSYQRLIHRPKLKDISNFLKAGGFFPNSILLNVKRKMRFDILKPEGEDGVTAGQLTLPNTYKSAWIIDGQHRLYGYTELEDNDHSPLLPFVAFESIPIVEETKLFADINSKQRSVSKKLLDEISGEIRLESADRKEQMRAIASRCFDLMRSDDDGPLCDKIAGAEVKKSDESILTIPYLVDAVQQAGLLGRVVTQNGTANYLQGPLQWDDPRKAITNLAELLTDYLNLFRNANEERWNSGKKSKFATNVGTAALIRLLNDLISFMNIRDDEDARQLHPSIIIERIEKYAAPCIKYFKTVPDEQLEKRFNVPFGSGGPRIFQHRLRELIGREFKSFEPAGFEADLRKFDADRRGMADQMVRVIQECVHRRIVERLKQLYGNSDQDLMAGIDNKEILKSASAKQIDDASSKKELATYLDFIELRKIIEAPKNWIHFKDEFNIQLSDDGKGRAKYLGWFDEINKLRRVSAHPFNRGYDDAEFDKLQLVFQRLKETGIVGDLK